MNGITFPYRPPGMILDDRRLVCTWCGQEFRNQSANAKVCGECKATDWYKEYARQRKLDSARRSRERATRSVG